LPRCRRRTRECHAPDLQRHQEFAGEALVIVVVASDDDIGVVIEECLEKRLDGEVVAMGAAGAEERLVPIGQGASGRVCSEIGAKPFFLG